MSKNSKITIILKKIFAPEIFLWVYSLLLILPNIALDFTESYAALPKICNVVLPVGIYMWLMGLWRNVGRTGVVLLFLVLFYGAFQIVLLFLYGESIIAVDMLLNVATTNVEEATELLGNLASAVITICVLYIPILVWGIILAVKKIFPSERSRKISRMVGGILAVTGAVTVILSYIFVPGFNFIRTIFPINVIHNTVTAVKRTVATENYFMTSAGFTYHASSTRDKEEKEVYILVIGETSRADNWQIYGYQRPTNPQLVHRNDMIAFSKSLSESNTTHKSVPMLLTWLTADNFNDSIYSTKSIITAFKESGYKTAFLSNQGRNHSFIDFFAQEADTTEFLRDKGVSHNDFELLAPLKHFLSSNNGGKLFVILHTYGSHFNYIDRYEAESAVFSPDDAALAEPGNRYQLINAYDNTIVQTDSLLNETMEILTREDCLSAMIYVSDHGEDIFDDSRERFLHASPVPTYYQIHVPLIVWMSPKLKNNYPAYYMTAYKNKDKNVSSSTSVFNTMLDIAGITTPYFDNTQSLTNSAYAGTSRVYLNDYNEKVDLIHVGLRDEDFKQLKKHGISATPSKN